MIIVIIDCVVSVESMFSQDVGDAVFDRMIDVVYKETSRHLLHVLHTKYKFMDHLKVIAVYFIYLLFIIWFIHTLNHSQ